MSKYIPSDCFGRGINEPLSFSLELRVVPTSHFSPPNSSYWVDARHKQTRTPACQMRSPTYTRGPPGAFYRAYRSAPPRGSDRPCAAGLRNDMMPSPARLLSACPRSEGRNRSRLWGVMLLWELSGDDGTSGNAGQSLQLLQTRAALIWIPDKWVAQAVGTICRWCSWVCWKPNSATIT